MGGLWHERLTSPGKLSAPPLQSPGGNVLFVVEQTILTRPSGEPLLPHKVVTFEVEADSVKEAAAVVLRREGGRLLGSAVAKGDLATLTAWRAGVLFTVFIRPA